MTVRKLGWIEDIIEHRRGSYGICARPCFDELRELVELAQSGLNQSQPIAGWYRSSDNDDSDPAERNSRPI
jgi:hypothetical protein